MSTTIKVFLCVALLLSGCTGKEETNPEVAFAPPANFPAPTYDFSRNPLTQNGIALGKALFNEPLLSRDNSIPCAECHSQTFAFTHHGHDVSHGIDNRKGTRNSLPVQNMAWESGFFWDGGVGDLDLVPIAPITNEVEMDETLGNVLDKLRATKKYPLLFKNAFGSEEITSERFLKALSQFMLTLVSGNSKYDKFVRNEGVSLTGQEQQGMALFRRHCSTCHAGELFTDKSYRNNGLFIQGIRDEGRYRVTGMAADRYTFRVPSLRNVGATAPYMHDGRFFTLEAVLEHYAGQVQDTPNLDPLLKQGTQRGIPLTPAEQTAIVAFLRTLTDDDFLTNKTFSP